MGCWDIQKSDASLEEDSRPWWAGVKTMVMGFTALFKGRTSAGSTNAFAT